jgi:hypothetical protein
MKKLRCLCVLITAAGVAACAKLPPANAPDLSDASDERTRRVLYERYKLEKNIGAFSATWKRADGEYSFPQLKEVARQFPESESVYTRTESRGLIIVTTGAIGGGIAGATFGWNAASPEEDRMSSGVQTALYATGGGLMVLAVALALAWPNPVDDLAEEYNGALQRRLGLAPGGGRPQQSSGVWAPRPVDGGIGWSF